MSLLVREKMVAAMLLLSAAVLQPAHAAEVQSADSVEALLATVERLEARLEALEALEARLEGVLANQAVTATAEPDGPEESPSREDGLPATTASKKTLYLPSRGWGGAKMHYGEQSTEVELHAFVDLEFSDSGPDGSRSGVSTFDNHHSNIFLEAELRPNLTGHVEIEFEHSGEAVEIDQAFVEWAATDWLSLDIGRFYTPFGIERFVWYSPTNALVSRPEPMRQIVPGNFYANGVMAQGVLEVGAAAHFTYEVAVSDGLGDVAATNRRGSRQARDNNSSKALSGRLSYAPSAFLQFGSSFHTQRYSSEGNLDLTFRGLDLAARWKGWELRSEYVEASVGTVAEDEAGVASPAPDLEQDGWYGQLAYTFDWFRALLPSLTLVTRFDSVDLDGSVVGGDDQTFWSIGLNALVHEHFRAKLEYRKAGEHGPRLDNDTFFSQIVIDF